MIISATKPADPPSKQEIINQILESRSPTKRRATLLYGVGINDCSFLCSSTIYGKRVEHSAYRNWKDMLARCYSKNSEYRTYSGCNVCKEWQTFSNFYSWWLKNSVLGWEIDKDLICTGNKVYCAEYCLYIPKKLNSFTIDRGESRGEFPIGVCFDKSKRLFMSSISNASGKRLFLGYFDNPEDAYQKWLAEKLKIAMSYKDVCDSIDKRIFPGLINKIKSLR